MAAIVDHRLLRTVGILAAGVMVLVIGAGAVVPAPSAPAAQPTDAERTTFEHLDFNDHSKFPAEFPTMADAFQSRFSGIPLRASRRAIESTPAKLFAHHRTVRRLQYMRDELEQGHPPFAAPFSLLLVESLTWGRYAAEGERISVAVHTGGPQPGDRVIVTAEVVLSAIETGQMSWQEAVRRKLIVVVPPGEDALASLRH